MKAILLTDYKVDENLTILKGAILEVIDNSSSFYVCKTYEGRYLKITSDYLKIIDYSPYIDWEQIRIQAAIAAMQNLCGCERFWSYPEEDIAKFSVKQADALIEQLKKKK